MVALTRSVSAVDSLCWNGPKSYLPCPWRAAFQANRDETVPITTVPITDPQSHIYADTDATSTSLEKDNGLLISINVPKRLISIIEISERVRVPKNPQNSLLLWNQWSV